VFIFSYGALLLPYSTELLSAEGLLGTQWRGLRFFQSALPNYLEANPSPGVAYAFVLVLTLAGAGVALGWFRRTCALVAWYAFACIVDRNVGLSNPGIPFAGWLCLACAIVPSGEGWTVSSRRANPDWQMPPALFRAAWIVMAVAYSVSGIAKLQSPEWIDGTALSYVIDLPFARQEGVVRLVAASPDFLLRIFTWTALVGEALFAPLSLFRVGRAIAWSMMVGMHVTLLLVMDFPELSSGMLLIHVFTFDRRWLT